MWPVTSFSLIIVPFLRLMTVSHTVQALNTWPASTFSLCGRTPAQGWQIERCILWERYTLPWVKNCLGVENGGAPSWWPSQSWHHWSHTRGWVFISPGSAETLTQGPVPHTLPKGSKCFFGICSLKRKPLSGLCVTFGKWSRVSRLVYLFLETTPPLKPLSKMVVKSGNFYGSDMSLLK